MTSTIDRTTASPGDDHHLVIGKVEALGHDDADELLLFHQGRYRTAE